MSGASTKRREFIGLVGGAAAWPVVAAGANSASAASERDVEPANSVFFDVEKFYRLDAMRRLMKFMHTMGAIGLMGAMACLLVLLSFTPAPSSLSQYVQMRAAMGGIAMWVFLPSLGLTLISGLLAIAINRAYHNAGWAWAKLASGILVFEWGFVAIQGPMQQEAEMSARALVHEVDPATLSASMGAEWNSLWVMLAVGAANVILGIWRPRLTRLPD